MRITKSLAITIGVLAAHLIFAYILPYFAPYDPRRWATVPRDMPPSNAFLFGTTTVGQDLFWLSSYALRNSITLGILTASISILIAFLLGATAGFVKKPALHNILTLCIDSFSLIPGLPALIVLTYSWRKYLSPILIALILSIFGWAWPSRSVRSLILSLRERPFTHTALLSGYSMIEIFFKEYLPYIIKWLAVSFLGLLTWAIGMETTIAVFGLSTLEEATIGSILYWALQYQAILRGIWWWPIIPILLLTTLIVTIYQLSNMIGELLGAR
ncbi:ABC transporter permease [Candidatus Bathyarchaeota archaeon]|nr:ABC transporter permease [Candidatus Bathyarchaeota archaeon]